LGVLSISNGILCCRYAIRKTSLEILKRFPLIKFLRRHYKLAFKGLKDNEPWSQTAEEFTMSHTIPGRLSLKFEAAGKVRVFAMVDYFSQYA